ncbi:MAG TPA: glyoxalase/bleomycin resistance/extradiol dioxygenase family protein [Myxococcaceae bacterium]|jgi:PhnB protein
MPQNFQPIIPYLAVDNASAAVELYVKAFGAREVSRQPAPNNPSKLLHVELEINGGRLMMADDFPEMRGGKASTAKALGGSPVTLHITSERAEQLFNQAVKAGAKVVMPFGPQFWGSNYGQVQDPFGLLWSLGTPEQALTDDQLRTGAEKAMGAAKA